MSGRSAPMRIMIVFGTRPEAVKLAPLVQACRRDPTRWCLTLVSTGQHREMLRPFETLFGMTPDHDLALMTPGQQPGDIVAGVLRALPPLLDSAAPDWVIVQGDTGSAFAAGLAGFLGKRRVAHVEAGLRTGDKHRPFPEEIYRRLVGQVADIHFAPTPTAAKNLSAEGVPAHSIEITGNTVVDALQWLLPRLEEPEVLPPEFRQRSAALLGRQGMVLITAHRRESFGGPMREIFQAVATLAAAHPDVSWVYPVHLNPNVQTPARALLAGLPNVHLIEPLGYAEFIYLASRSTFVLTDSGGVQEEAPSLRKPAVVLRGTTERHEGVAAGCALLTGTEAGAIVETAQRLLLDEELRRRMAAAANPYGDGRAAERILERLSRGRDLP